MIRKSTININYATNQKKQLLDSIIDEYKRIVNLYINHLWQKKLLRFVEFKVDTWLSARLQQLAGKTAIQTIKSVRKKDRVIRYNRYKKVFYYFKNKNKQIKFTSKRFSELNLNWKIKPIYKSDTIEFDQRFIEVQNGNNSFDLWIKIRSIGNGIKLFLPSKKHLHLKRYENWDRKKSVRIRKTKRGYFCDLIFETDTPLLKENGNHLAIDIGINKLMSLSTGRFLGQGIKQLLKKLNNRKQKSKRWFQTIRQIKNYVGNQCNKIDLKNINILILEDLKKLSNKKSNKNNKTFRQLLGYWNRTLLTNKLRSLCEENRVYLHFVDPAYTSQECSSCHHISKNNRLAENFKCEQCDFTCDADYNAALNIANRYRQSIVAYS